VGDALQRFAETKQAYGLTHALRALLARLATALYSDERHLIIAKRIDAQPGPGTTDEFTIHSLESRSDLARVATVSDHHLLRQRTRVFLESGYSAQFACSADGAPVGHLWCAAGNIARDHSDVVLHRIDLADDEAYVFSLFVTPAGRGERIAPALLRQTEAALRARGYRRMVGWVDARNRPARWFFSTSGFEVTETVRITFVLSLVALSRERILVRKLPGLSRHAFGYRVVRAGSGGRGFLGR
jgi:ribosomal protein S18 acetylase RimI-like enzyme